MDWALAIERNREPLLRIIATLFAMIGLTGTGAVERLSRPLYRTVLGVLRPAEAAVRRLIVVAARGMVVKPRQRRPAPVGLAISGTGRGRLSFQLFDPRRPCGEGNGRRHAGPRPQPHIRFIDVAFDPRISVFRHAASAAAAPAPDAEDAVADATVNAIPLCRRLAAIRGALEDLPRQARRYVRWQARPVDARRPQRATPLRPGPPPGCRKPVHEVDDILARCHWLARNVSEPDTS
ncbi:MAG: hypothetical protein AB7F76_14900 [Parvibaculaceae bacterium]